MVTIQRILIVTGLIAAGFVICKHSHSAEIIMPTRVVVAKGGDCIAKRVLSPDSTYEDFLRMDCDYLVNLNKIEPSAGEEQEDGWSPPPMPANTREHTIIFE